MILVQEWKELIWKGWRIKSFVYKTDTTEFDTLISTYFQFESNKCAFYAYGKCAWNRDGINFMWNFQFKKQIACKWTASLVDSKYLSSNYCCH